MAQHKGAAKVGGRQKGTPNKVTLAAKEAIHQAFEDMGGVPALIQWADKSDDNRKVFYSVIWPKIIPLTIGGDPGNPVLAVIEQHIVRPE